MSLEIALATNTAAINALIAILSAKGQNITEPEAPKKTVYTAPADTQLAAQTEPSTTIQAPAAAETAPASPSEPELTDEVIRALGMLKRDEGKDSIGLIKSYGGVSKCPLDKRAELYAALQAL